MQSRRPPDENAFCQSPRHSGRNELVSQFSCLLAHVFQLLNLVLLLVLFYTDPLVLHLILQHPVYHPGNRMSCGYGRLGRSQPGFQAPVRHPKDTVRLFCPFRLSPFEMFLASPVTFGYLTFSSGSPPCCQFSNQFDRKPRCTAGLRLCASPLLCTACELADSEYTFSKTGAAVSLGKNDGPHLLGCTRLVGVCAFSGTLHGLELVPSKWRCLVPPTSG